MKKSAALDLFRCFPVYDGNTHRLSIEVRPPMDDLLTADDNIIARRMNEEVEVLRWGRILSNTRGS